MEEKRISNEKVPFEAALDKVGFGWYSYIVTCMTGVAIISYVCIGYGSTIIVPTSACELQTTTAQQGILAAGPVVGSLLGGVAWGHLADTRGRRKMLIASLLGGAIINGLAALSVNWIMLMVFQFVAALFTSGLYSMSMALLSECVPMAKRNLVVLLVSSIFLLSQGLMALLAIPIIPLTFSYHIPSLGIYWNSWRALMLVYSAPSLITALWVFFLQESPKFVFMKGREDEALEILKNIHRVNNCGKKEELDVQGFIKEDSQVSSAIGSGSFKDLFKFPLLKYTILMILLMMFKQDGVFKVWLPTIADQFVRNLEAGEGNDLNMCAILDINLDAPANDIDVAPCSLNVASLLIVLGVGVLMSVCNIFVSIALNFIGRRTMIIIITAVCGGCGILVNLVPNAIGSAVLFSILNVATVVLGLYTAIMVALFPTHLRALALALVISCARLATFASIQIFNFLLTVNCDAAFYLYSSLLATSAIIALFLPKDQKTTQKHEVTENIENNEKTSL